MFKLSTRKVQTNSAYYAIGIMAAARVSLQNYASCQCGLTKDEQEEVRQLAKQLNDLSDRIGKRLNEDDG